MTDDMKLRFDRDVADHEMTIAHDDGLYRHIRFRKPESTFYWFDLITWPGRLTVDGDMETFTFARLTDMLQFFRADRGRINPGYWSEKLCGPVKTREYSEERFRSMVTEYARDHEKGFPGLLDAVLLRVFEDNDVYHEDGARMALQEFRHGKFEFLDLWEWDFTEHTAQYLWCCHAIQWGIARYDAAKQDGP